MSIRIGTLDRTAIDAFKAKWPCHGLPDNLDLLVAAFDGRTGDLLDFECADENDARLDSQEFDGSALAALVDDCAKVATDRPIAPGCI